MRAFTRPVKKFVPPTYAEILAKVAKFRGYLSTPECVALGESIDKMTTHTELVAANRKLNMTVFKSHAERSTLYCLITECVNKLNTTPR